jgi:hypothetical protein
VKEDNQQAYNYIVLHTKSPSVILSSLQGSSGLYEHQSPNIDSLQQVYPKPILPYMVSTGKIHKNVSEIYMSIKRSDGNQLLISRYELENGLYGGVSVSPLVATEVRILADLLYYNDNLIYNSNKSKIFLIIKLTNN